MSNRGSRTLFTLFSLWDNGCGSDISIGLVLFLLAGPDLACVTGNLKKFRAEAGYIVAHISEKGTTFLLILITLDTVQS